MNLKFLAFLAAAFLTLSVMSCNDDDDTSTETENTLTSQDWKMTSNISIAALEVETIQDCDKDDKHTFASGGTYTLDYGTDLCNTGETTDTNSWSLNNSGSKLTYNGIEYDIDEISSSVMTLSNTSSFLGITSGERFTFVPFQ